MHMLGHILFGLVVGIIAKFLMPGHQPGGFIATILIGIVGAWLGGQLGRMLGLYPAGHPAGFFMAVIGAMLLLFIYGWVFRSSATHASLSDPATHIAQISVAHRIQQCRPVTIRA